jgi:hypothetical protein
MAVCARPAVVLVGGTVPRCSCHSIMHQSSSDGRVHGRNLLFVDRLSHTFLLYLSIQVPTTEYRTYSMTFEENRSKDREWSGIRIAYIGTSRIVVTRRVTRNNKLSFLSEPTRSIFPPVKAKTRSAPTHPPTQKRNSIEAPHTNKLKRARTLRAPAPLANYSGVFRSLIPLAAGATRRAIGRRAVINEHDGDRPATEEPVGKLMLVRVALDGDVRSHNV